jgi:CRISPR-associated protein Cas2
MTIILVSRVTPAARGLLSRWMLQIESGVFLGHLSKRVRERVWHRLLGMKRLGVCTLISHVPTEQGFSVVRMGDADTEVVDFDGLLLVRRKVTASRPASASSAFAP